ncbi:MAG: hypothetical protein R8N50_04165 [Alphaproteobacteria bacterium]|nr:hypothetical protein [Alphaproteobacteria bacterium]
MVSFNPKTNKIDLTEDNTTYTLGPNQPLIKVSSVKEEKIYIAKLYPEFELLEQRLIKVNIGDRVVPVDLLRVNTNAGEKTFYFDVRELFEKYHTIFSHVDDTDYDSIYKIFRYTLAKSWQKFHPGIELKQERTLKLFVDFMRSMTDDELVKSDKYSNKQSIPKQISDDALSEFVKILKSKNKNKEDKTKTTELLKRIYMLDLVLNTDKQIKKSITNNKQIPENAIDRFFYKIGRGTKNTGKTIAESEVVGKTVGFLFRDPWGPIVVWVLMILAVGGVFTLLGFE